MPLSLKLLTVLQSELCALDWLMSLSSPLQYKGLDMVLPTMTNIKPMYLSRDALSALWALEEKLQKGADDRWHIGGSNRLCSKPHSIF